MNDGAFIGQFPAGPGERVEVWLREIDGNRMLVFSVIGSSDGKPVRGGAGLMVEVAQIPH